MKKIITSALILLFASSYTIAQTTESGTQKPVVVSNTQKKNATITSEKVNTSNLTPISVQTATPITTVPATTLKEEDIKPVTTKKNQTKQK